MSESAIRRRLETLERRAADLAALAREERALASWGESAPDEEVESVIAGMARCQRRRRAILGLPDPPPISRQRAIEELARLLDVDPRDVAQAFARGR